MKRSAFGFGMEVEVQVVEGILIERDHYGSAGWVETCSGSGGRRVRIFVSEGRTSFERFGRTRGIFGPEETPDLPVKHARLLLQMAPDNPDRCLKWVDKSKTTESCRHPARLQLKKPLKSAFHRVHPARMAIH